MLSAAKSKHFVRHHYSLFQRLSYYNPRDASTPPRYAQHD